MKTLKSICAAGVLALALTMATPTTAHADCIPIDPSYATEANLGPIFMWLLYNDPGFLASFPWDYPEEAMLWLLSNICV